MFNLAQLLQRMLSSNMAHPSRRRVAAQSHSGESLEDRKLLAAMVNAKTLKYQDVDGDTVTVTFNKNVLTDANVNQIFKFNTGSVDGSQSTKQQLRTINLNGIAAADGAKVTTKATKSNANGGNNDADLGQLLADHNLGVVTIDGDLGRFVVDGTVTSLTAGSLGKKGMTTGAVDLHSTAYQMNTFTINGDMQDASVAIQGPNGPAELGVVHIKGSLIGGFQTNSGDIYSSGHISSVIVQGDVLGGSGGHSGRISSGSIDKLTINGSVKGGSGKDSGEIGTTGPLGTVLIKGDLKGGLGFASGVLSGATATSITVQGSLVGGDGLSSGIILTQTGDLKSVLIGKDVQGGKGVESGGIGSAGKIDKLIVGGKIQGDQGQFSGFAEASQGIGIANIAGNVAGGLGNGSGFIRSEQGGIQSVTIGGSLTGLAMGSGFVSASKDIGTVAITGDVSGGLGSGSGRIESTDGKLTKVTIGGSLLGIEKGSGQIMSKGDMGTISIVQDVKGINDNSGLIKTEGNLTSLTIGGSILGGNNRSSDIIVYGYAGTIAVGGDVRGGGSESGWIHVVGNVENLKIQGSLIGGNVFLNGSNDYSGTVSVEGELKTGMIGGDIIGSSAFGANKADATGLVAVGRIGSLTLGGSLIAGVDSTSGAYQNNGAIVAADDIGTLLIKGNIMGNSTNHAEIRARGQKTPTPGAADLAIASLTVNGNVILSVLEAGDTRSAAIESNNDAQIGSVKVLGNWTSSNITAGASAGPDGKFGTNDDSTFPNAPKDDPATNSKIGKIEIGGFLRGTLGGTDHYGFVAQEVGSFKHNGSIILLTAGSSNDLVSVGQTGDVTIRELV